MLVARHKGEQNIAVLDPWTAVHFGSGLALGLLDAPFGVAAAGAVIYEVIEQRVEGPRAEVTGNAVADVGVVLFAWWLGRRWNET